MTKTLENPPQNLQPEASNIAPSEQLVDSLTEQFEAARQLLAQPEAVIERAHADGQIHGASVNDLGGANGCPHMAGMSREQVVSAVAFASLAESFGFVSTKKAETVTAEPAVERSRGAETPAVKVAAEANNVLMVDAEVSAARQAVVMQLQRQTYERAVTLVEPRSIEAVIRGPIKPVKQADSRLKSELKPQIEQRIKPTPINVIVEAQPQPLLDSVVAIAPAPEIAPLVTISRSIQSHAPVKAPAVPEVLALSDQAPTIEPNAEAEIAITGELEPAQNVLAETGGPVTIEEVTVDDLFAETTEETEVTTVVDTTPSAVAQASRATPEAPGATPELVSESAQFVASLLTEMLPPSPELKSNDTPRAMIVETFLQALEPEQIVDIEARIEQLAVVADRLHFLVETDAGEGKEARQIDVFLAQEFEQFLIELKPLLQAMGIEPTQESAQAFVAYVRSERYQSKTDILAHFIEIEDEGTHEKKLFDEAGVFAKAQSATKEWRLNLQTMIGRLTVYNAAA